MEINEILNGLGDGSCSRTQGVSPAFIPQQRGCGCGIWWIIILLIFFCGGGFGFNNMNNMNNCCCCKKHNQAPANTGCGGQEFLWFIVIVILLCGCGNNGFGNGFGNGCGF